MQNLSHQAIHQALSQEWNEAIVTNEAILKENDSDVDTLNRLAYAFIKVGKIEKAKKIYRKIFTLDRYNYIAQKNLEKINSLSKTSKKLLNGSTHNNNLLSTSLFIEEPGRTKTLNLINLAPVSTLSNIGIGDEVLLFPKKHSIEIRLANKTYLGALPDDIAFRLLKFLKAGNTYYSCIKNVQKKFVSIFIREIKRGKRFASQSTFLPTTHELSATTPREIKNVLKNEDDIEEANQEDLEE